MGVTKQWPGHRAVDEIDLVIERGDFTTLLGPSGCGKTTTLRMIAGLEEPDAGEIYIDGRLVFSARQGINVPPARRGLGLIFQSYALWPHMTVFENVAFGLVQRKVPREEVRRQVEAVLAKVELAGLAERYPSELSGGQQQRVAVARMLVVSPALLLMDEPLSNLDARLRMQMRAELKRMHQETGTTVVYVTHDQEEALTLSTRIAVLQDGRLEQVGEPEEVYERPATRFVADFTGNPRTNFLEAAVDAAGSGPNLTVADLGLERSVAGGLERVLVAVRPEDVAVHAEERAGLLPGRVYAALPVGAQVLVYVRVNGAEVVARAQRGSRFRADQPVWLDVDRRRLNVYDPRTGRRVA